MPNIVSNATSKAKLTFFYLFIHVLLTFKICNFANAQEINQELSSLKQRIDKLEQNISRQGNIKNILTDNRFNPQIGLLINGKFYRSSTNNEDFSLAGFQSPSHLHSAKQGFSFYESELSMTADVDNLFKIDSNIIFLDDEGEDKVEIEVLNAETTSLPYGFNIKFGRFLADIGYLNNKHLHTDNFSNRPIAFQAFLGNHYFDDGAQISWLLPVNFYSEIGLAAFSGNNFPAGGRSSSGIPVQSAFLKFGGELPYGEIKTGLSYLKVSTGDDGRKYSHNHNGIIEELSFAGESNLFIADFKYSFSPIMNSGKNELIIQSEYFNRHEDGNYSLFANDNVEESDNFKSSQSGFYTEVVYKFLPKWRLGYRYSKLYGSKARDVANFDEASINSKGHNPSSNTIMVDYTNSEFSRIRIEYENQNLMPGKKDSGLTIQYIMSIGAHKIHKF